MSRPGCARNALTIFAATGFGLALLAGCAVPQRSEKVATAAGVPLVNTRWRLVQLGEQVVGNPPGTDPVGLQLQPQNLRMTGFAGCNRLFGGYLLDGNQLRFDQVGGTRMACTDDSRMKLEQDFVAMLSQVSAWKIDGNTLGLADSSGATLATLEAVPAETR